MNEHTENKNILWASNLDSIGDLFRKSRFTVEICGKGNESLGLMVKSVSPSFYETGTLLTIDIIETEKLQCLKFEIDTVGHKNVDINVNYYDHASDKKLATLVCPSCEIYTANHTLVTDKNNGNESLIHQIVFTVDDVKLKVFN